MFVVFKMLEYGDVVLADRDFTIEEDIASCGAKLELPAFTRGKAQLPQKEVENDYLQLRIHVERIIGLLKNRSSIMKGPIPITLRYSTNVIETNLL